MTDHEAVAFVVPSGNSDWPPKASPDMQLASNLTMTKTGAEASDEKPSASSANAASSSSLTITIKNPNPAPKKEVSPASTNDGRPVPTVTPHNSRKDSQASADTPKKEPSVVTNTTGSSSANASGSGNERGRLPKAEKKKRGEKAKKPGKKRKNNRSAAAMSDTASQEGDVVAEPKGKPGPKKGKKRKGDDGKPKKKKSKMTPAQEAVNDMMRQLLEEDKYSFKGSIVDGDSTDEEDDERAVYAISGSASGSKRGHYAQEEATLVHLDRATIVRAARKRLRFEGMRGVMDTTAGGGRKRSPSIVIVEEGADTNALAISESMSDDAGAGGRSGKKKKRKKVKRANTSVNTGTCIEVPVDETIVNTTDASQTSEGTLKDDSSDEMLGEDESSIFGQTTGSSNATWVECDKCKKWRRLRGIVDAKKLPPKWFCSMNKNDPERARCSAPEEEYETQNTPETITDKRARKHFRLWVRRLQCMEAYEARLPTMTRGKRRNATGPKDPYEWVRCCNPSCGKWRAVLRSMDASSVIDAAKNGEWYCVLNTWDEKTASCAAPQESLPAIGCPPWVMQNEE